MEDLLCTQNPLLVHFAWFLHEVKTKCEWATKANWDVTLWLWWAFQNGALAIVARRAGDRLIPDTGLIYRRGDFSDPSWVSYLYSNPGGPDVWVDFCSGSYRNAMLYLATLWPRRIGWCRQSTDKIHVRKFSRMPFCHSLPPRPYNNHDPLRLAD